MLKKITAALTALCLILSPALWGGEARAEETLGPCSVTVEVAAELRDDPAGVVIDLYQLAAAEDGTAGYSLHYLAPFTALAEFDAGDAAGRQAMARSAAETALAEGAPVVTGAPVGAVIDRTNGGAPLGAGLYLLIARGAELADYYGTEPDEDGADALVTYARSEDYDYIFSPELIGLPASVGGEVPDTETVWAPDVTVSLKTARRARYGALEIVKRLLTYDASEPATFVFDISAVMDGEVVYSNVASFTFTAPGEQSALLERIPVGAAVTVTEIYGGARYALTTADAARRVVIGAEQTAVTEFENDYVGTPKSGHGITNHFTYDGETWVWVQTAGG